MEAKHLRLDVAVGTSRAVASHEADCPEIGPICRVRDEPPQRHVTTLWATDVRVLGEYGLADRLALQGILPLRFVSTHTRFTDLAGITIHPDYADIHHRDEVLAGLGDAQLLLHHSDSWGGLLFGERLGASLPTGKIQPNPEKLGAEGLPHEHIQLGTGTLDPILGLDASKRFESWTLSAFAQGQVPVYAGRYGYQAGARLFAGAVAQSGLGLEDVTFRLGITAFHEGAERWDGVVPTEDGNQGRTDLFLAPGVTFPLWGEWTASVDLRARVWGRTVNAQLDMPLVAELSIGRLFHLEEPGEAEETPAPAAQTGDVQDAVHEGEAAPLTPVAGHWTVFDFWAPWCEACKRLDGELRALAARDPRIALRRVNIVDFDSPIAQRELAGVSVLPHVRLVAPDGSVAYEASDAPAELLQAIGQHVGR